MLMPRCLEGPAEIMDGEFVVKNGSKAGLAWQWVSQYGESLVYDSQNR